MSPYVQKLRVAVRLSQPNRDPREGWFLLLPRLGQESRPETILELLNASRSVIPFIQADDASVLLLTRLNIDWVGVGPGVASNLVFPPDEPVTHEQRVELRFVDERRLEATVQWWAGEQNLRLSDFLCASTGFIAAQTGFGTLMVNLGRVRETRIAESTARVLDPVE